MAKSRTQTSARNPVRKNKLPIPPAITVASYRRSAEREADEAEQSQLDPLGKFAALGAVAFDRAATLAKMAASKQPPTVPAFLGEFVRLDAFISRWRKLPDREQLWQCWPATPGVTYGHYMRAGDSALDLAIVFAESVRGAVLVARAFSTQTFQTDAMVVEPPPDAKLLKWRDAVMKELAEKTLDLRNWPMADLHRDTDSLLRRINAEWLKALSKEPTPTIVQTVVSEPRRTGRPSEEERDNAIRQRWKSDGAMYRSKAAFFRAIGMKVDAGYKALRRAEAKAVYPE